MANNEKKEVIDLGGVPIDPSEIVTDKLVEWLSNSDTKYQNFLEKTNDEKKTISGDDLKCSPVPKP
jgi:predicted nucleic acid-binding OB-fold protein